tara:strand:+ start:1538 stop:2152 length:615 start_codon:yes stop_codon:yes gene_type:complete
MEQILPLFSKPLFLKHINFSLKKTEGIIKKVKFKEANEKLSFEESQMSIDTYVLDRPDFKFLKQILYKELNAYTKDYLHYINNFKITTSWLTKIEPNSTSNLHNHQNCMLSGVLYLNVDKDSGNIRFDSFADSRYWLEKTDFDIFNSTGWFIEPSNKLLLIFPSEVHHIVEENKSKMTRYSLAFNAVPTGIVGEKDSDSHIKMS